MTDQPARAAVGSLPPNPPATEGETEGHKHSFEGSESATAPDEFGAAVGSIDPFALVGTIKSLVSMGTKVLGLVSKFPGPQQQAAQELLSILNEVNSVLSRIP